MVVPADELRVGEEEKCSPQIKLQGSNLGSQRELNREKYRQPVRLPAFYPHALLCSHLVVVSGLRSARPPMRLMSLSQVRIPGATITRSQGGLVASEPRGRGAKGASAMCHAGLRLGLPLLPLP